jgi:hypothetical protein
MRNILLTYRLLHFQSKIPDIKLNIDNREKQLFKPILRVFQDAKTTLKELLPVISEYVSQKRESNANTLHAYLYRLIKDLIKAEDKTELEISLIWNTIINTLSGSSNPNKPQSYESTEYDTISKKRIIETLIQVFGARPSRDRKSRKLIFDQIKLQRLSKIYDLEIDVKVGTSIMTDVTDVTDVGLDKHFFAPSDNKEIATNKEQTNHNSNEIVKNGTADKDHPCYPTKADLERLGLKAQGKSWEI